MKKENSSTKSYIFSLLRVFFLLFIALIVPRFFLTEEKIKSYGTGNSSFKLGLENITKDFLLRVSPTKDLSYRVGLITNHTGLDLQGNRNIDILKSHGLHIEKIYVPEDDIFSYKINNNSDMVDEATNIPIRMLTPENTSKKSSDYVFNDIDVIFFDLQDSGVTSSYYLRTLFKTLQSAAHQNKTVVVLDRPNVLGSTMEGMVGETTSPADSVPVPLRHGMTFGELARHFNTNVLTKSARLFIVPMHNYNRNMPINTQGALHASLLTNIDTYYGSSFLTILNSVAPLDIGIGTDLAFGCLTLPEYMHFPKQKWFELRAILKHHGIETSWCRYVNPKKHCSFAGLRLMVRNIEQFSPFISVMTVVQFFKEAGVTLTFNADFDRAFGGKKMREYLEGSLSRLDLERLVNGGLKNFYNKAHSSFLYKPVPSVILL
jgi:uncharacterized protein YbbC (DUF1343 family)